jgi:hypothetical protein
MVEQVVVARCHLQQRVCARNSSNCPLESWCQVCGKILTSSCRSQILEKNCESRIEPLLFQHYARQCNVHPNNRGSSLCIHTMVWYCKPGDHQSDKHSVKIQRDLSWHGKSSKFSCCQVLKHLFGTSDTCSRFKPSPNTSQCHDACPKCASRR